MVDIYLSEANCGYVILKGMVDNIITIQLPKNNNPEEHQHNDIWVFAEDKGQEEESGGGHHCDLVVDLDGVCGIIKPLRKRACNRCTIGGARWQLIEMRRAVEGEVVVQLLQDQCKRNPNFDLRKENIFQASQPNKKNYPL